MRVNSWVRWFLVVWLTACAAGSDAPGDDSMCTVPGEQKIVLAVPASPDLQFHMDTCRLDIDACHELCVLAIESAVHDPWGEPVSCDVTFFTSSVALDAHYQVATGHNCPVPRTDSP